MAMTFPLGDILSITTERLVSRDHMDGVYKILGYMTGDELFTHQLPRAAEECRPALLVQHPQLRDVDVPFAFTGDGHVYEWLAEQEARFGAELDVDPLVLKQGDYSDPIGEMVARFGPDKVLPIVLGDDQ
jgi:hypothetical protein